MIVKYDYIIIDPVISFSLSTWILQVPFFSKFFQGFNNYCKSNNLSMYQTPFDTIIIITFAVKTGWHWFFRFWVHSIEFVLSGIDILNNKQFCIVKLILR